MFYALVASALAAPPPTGDMALLWALHRANVALQEETEGYRSTTVGLMIGNGDPPDEIRAQVAERRAMLDGLAADRAQLAADTEAAGFDPTEQLAIHDAAVARIEALMPKSVGTVLRFKLELLETMGGDTDEWRVLGEEVVACLDAVPGDDRGILLLGVAAGLRKAGAPDDTLRYLTACTEACPDDLSRSAAWYMLLNEHARRQDRAACRAAALELLAFPDTQAEWLATARTVVEGTADLDPDSPPLAPLPTDPAETPAEAPTEPDPPVEEPDPPRRRFHLPRVDEPGFLLFRGGPTYDLAAATYGGEPVTRLSGYHFGYGYGIRHVAMDAQFRHDGWSVAEPSAYVDPYAPPGTEPGVGTLELRTNRVEVGLVFDLLGVSTERRLRPTLGPYGALGLGWGRDTHVTADDSVAESPLFALGVVYGAKAGLGVRIGRDFLLEAQARVARSPYGWGVDGTPLDYAFARGWELQAALAIGTQAD